MLKGQNGICVEAYFFHIVRIGVTQDEGLCLLRRLVTLWLNSILYLCSCTCFRRMSEVMNLAHCCKWPESCAETLPGDLTSSDVGHPRTFDSPGQAWVGVVTRVVLCSLKEAKERPLDLISRSVSELGSLGHRRYLIGIVPINICTHTLMKCPTGRSSYNAKEPLWGTWCFSVV